ncbi:FmdB family zinc ribbon protein [Pseudomonas sp. nanlin1]|uniref:FmdB family zinc ribbon protein n=1 Tax=Pseudomonas sp. nanlin1 TaxID=3040605 RepID=UPI00389012F0
MPIYEYDCTTCGDFTALRPMAQRDVPCQCPACGSAARRVILTAPGLACMPGHTRRGMEINERSRHEPKNLEQYRESRRHPSGCSCCGPTQPVVASAANPHGLKGKPQGRPWMISH